MKKILSILLLAAPLMVFAQDAEEQPAVPSKPKPVSSTFENPLLINNQTVMATPAKTLDFVIEHRFGLIKNEEDLFGLYAPSNIRLGLTYGFHDRLAIGLGATKYKQLYDLNWKVPIVRQAKKGGSPVSVTYFGDVARSARRESNFLNEDGEYKVNNRYSFFNELMVAWKFKDNVSLQAAFTHSHINLVDTGRIHTYYGLSFLGRYRFSPQSSIIAEFDAPLNHNSEVTITYPSDNTVDVLTKYYPRTNLSLGLEVSTSSHQFQIFVCTADQIVNQEMRAFNRNDWTKREVLLGFNITRQWGF